MTPKRIYPKVEFEYTPRHSIPGTYDVRVSSVEPLPPKEEGVVLVVPADYIPYADPTRLYQEDVFYIQDDKLVLAVPTREQFYSTAEVADILECTPQVVGFRQKTRRKHGIPTGRNMCNATVWTADDISKLADGQYRGRPS